MATPLIVVVGSVSTELLVRVPEIPVAGRVVVGSDLVARPGGRGANQAVAAARLGATTHLVARVGADDLGNRLLSALEAQGVSTTFVTVTDDVASGTATVIVDETAEQFTSAVGGSARATVLSPGANAKLTPADVDRALPLLRTASAVLLQLEIPIETVLHTLTLCHLHRVHVILDPGPLPTSGRLPPELLAPSVLTPDLHEAQLLLGLVGPHDPRMPVADPRPLATDLLARGAGAVVLKLGDQGSLYATQEGGGRGASVLQVPAFKVKLKDATAAGDAFNAALAVARAEGQPPADALRFANAAGALACTHAGGQSSLPLRVDVDDLLRRWG